MRNKPDEFYEEQDVQDTKPNKGKKFGVGMLILGIVGAILFIAGIALFVIAGTGSMAGPLVGMLLFGVGAVLMGIGFSPLVTKVGAKINKGTMEYASEDLKNMSKTAINLNKDIQEENKDSLSQMASTMAEINQTAVTTTARAVKKGLKDTKFCKECGAQIDADSKFCNNCGTKQ